MGYVTLLFLATGAFLGLIALRVKRPLWSFAGSALTLGAAGYALQGRPGLPVAPASGVPADDRIDTDMLVLRDQMLGRFSADGAYLVASDAMTRAGDRRAAVRVILAGIGRIPGSTTLWTGLGTALAAHDGDRVSPAALLAFRHAASLSPEHPAPPFFTGMAYAASGDLRAAQPYLRRALYLTPPAASYRQDIAMRLALVDRYLAQRRGSR